MTQEELKKLLDELRALPSETEWLEFKGSKDDYNFNKLGKYFSALSNEANLKDKLYGWLIFGIEDKTRDVIGSRYRPHRNELDSLKSEIANKTTNRITFMEIHELHLHEGRVIMFQIPAAPKGIPIAWEGHYYGRDGQSIGALNLQEIEQIRNQIKNFDWSAQICDGATIHDLNKDAIIKAREKYREKFPQKIRNVNEWDDIIFLNKAKITIQNKITRTAIILLGKEESEHFLSPSIAKISWILKDENDLEKDYEHFGPPFLLNSDAVYSKIRNLKYRYLLKNTLFPTEITQYEPYVIREALHNCIAHQDYGLKGRITVVEKPDELLFANLGSFIPGSVEKVIEQDAPQEYYRNQFLVNAMVNLNMIDTIGSGIKKMFILQRNRYFPMPDYDLGEPDKVKVRIIGKVLDENYTKMLIDNTSLDIKIVIYLDKVQKRQRLTKDEFKTLKAQKLIEGRYPNLFVVAKIAAIAGDKASYIKNRAFDDEHYKKMILEFIKKYGNASRQDIDKLLIDKLSNVLDEKQKRNKIKNLIYEMSKKDRTIKNTGSYKKPIWILFKF
ncbi:Divergent AAA domain protein [Candidatus Brocadiaceae bacterium B188]|nr:putative DNA binding domain-containing protein [Candidatus Brocadia sapporoensis]QQR65572.1 MAG: putative DNA binding domain-containing protein [Candidatus Brocadia sp.]RZV57293.1 MAG: transcriptional regulator [Candidatus Brocadia sp. BROELEC01]TWU50483.1 Divergent AAA domain protein [Candidatus Brocadiaceae bacterium B188]